jgi:hypothetical protein
MTQQTGNDLYLGTTPPRKSQEPQQPPAGEMMLEPKQAGMQMDNQTRRANREQRRQQAGQQSDQGLGDSGRDYSAQDGEDAADANKRGYGDGAEMREEKLREGA